MIAARQLGNGVDRNPRVVRNLLVAGQIELGGHSRSTRSLIIGILLCANTDPKSATIQALAPEALGVAWLRERRDRVNHYRYFTLL